jgi:hypothetical protein
MKTWFTKVAGALLLAAALLLGPVPQPAQATQNATSCPTTGTLSGLALVQCINNAFATTVSQFSGASAPSSPTTWQLWADTTNNILKIYNGTAWLPIGSFSGSRWTPFNGGIAANALTATGSANAYVLTYSPAPSGLVTGQIYSFVANFANTGASTININSLGAKNITKNGTAALSTGDLASGQAVSVLYDGTEFQMVSPAATTASTIAVPVRQTVLSGPVTSAGLPNFGGSTGATTLTASGTLVAAAANGFGASGQIDRVCSVTNPSWTGLSTNGTMYLYLDATTGSCGTGAGTLAPTYQFGGAFSTTNGQFTFNTQQMTGQVGNGATAAQSYRVYVGEVTVGGGNVTAITWYALMGRYQSATAALAAVNTTISFSHNLGVKPLNTQLHMVNATAELGYAAGDDVASPFGNTGGARVQYVFTSRDDDKTIYFHTMSTAAFEVVNLSTGTIAAVTAANWGLYATAERGW